MQEKVDGFFLKTERDKTIQEASHHTHGGIWPAEKKKQKRLISHSGSAILAADRIGAAYKEAHRDRLQRKQ